MTPFWQPEDREPMDRAKIMGTKNPAYYHYVTTKLPDFRELKEADEVFNPCDKIDRAVEELHSKFPSPEPRGPKEQERKLLQQRRADKIKQHIQIRKPSVHARDFMTGQRSAESHERTRKLQMEADLLKKQREIDKLTLQKIARNSKTGSSSSKHAKAKESPRTSMMKSGPVDPNEFKARAPLKVHQKR